jgi:hypothetical protein
MDVLLRAFAPSWPTASQLRDCLNYRADPPQSSKPRTMTLATGEFIRRFLRHVRRAGFHRIRYDGFLGARHRREKLARDLQRIWLYAEKGSQIHQDVPDDVWEAYEQLVKAGYDTHLLSA